MKSLKSIVLLCLLVCAIFSLDRRNVFADQENQWAICQYDQSTCQLRHSREFFSSPDQGARLWFGKQLTLKCSFYVYTHLSYPGLLWIKAGGPVVNENGAKPRYYAHHVAFLDANDNLIACAGDFLVDNRVGNKPESRSQDIPIPLESHPAIAQFKSAFYESDKAIGVRACKPVSMPDASKAEGASRKAAMKINTKQRPLLEKPPAGVRTFTVDGPCKVKSDREWDPKDEPHVLIGDESAAKAKVFFRMEGKEISSYYALTNYKNTSTYQDLYVAFFDDAGHLIASTWLKECKTGPKKTTPSLMIDGVPVDVSVDQTKYSVLSTFSGQLPLGEHKRISNFKMTMYVYDKAKRSSE